MDKYEALDEVLVRLFNSIMHIEAKALIEGEFADLTNNDMHVINAIGIGKKRNMSTIAGKLWITMGSLTIAMNGLVRKGYVVRERGEEDKRVVYITLTEKGKKAYAKHREFHNEMLASMVGMVSEQELKLITDSLYRLEDWLINTHVK